MISPSWGLPPRRRQRWGESLAHQAEHPLAGNPDVADNPPRATAYRITLSGLVLLRPGGLMALFAPPLTPDAGLHPCMPADAVGLEVEALVEAVFDVNAGFADAYTAELPALMPKAGEHVGHEENVEAGLPVSAKRWHGRRVLFRSAGPVARHAAHGRHSRLDLEERADPGCHRGETLPRQSDMAQQLADHRKAFAQGQGPGRKAVAYIVSCSYRQFRDRDS